MVDRIFGKHATTVRISIGLTGIVVSIMLVAALLGLTPDRYLLIAQQRATLAAALAANGYAFITLSNLNGFATALQTIVELNEDILSAGIKKWRVNLCS